MSTETNILDTIFEPEELHPDLARYVETLDIGPALRHPLVYSVPHWPALNRHSNLLYAQKLRYIEEMREAQNWGGVLSMYEPPCRLDALLDLAEEITDPRAFWGFVRDIWIGTEQIHGQFDLWQEVWTASDNPDLLTSRTSAMYEGERKALASLPPLVTVWRGAGAEEWAESGMSWCLDQGTAEWFAWRYREGRRIPSCARATLPRAEVIALLLSRSELEIVADPDSLLIEDVYPAPRTIKKPEPLWKFSKS